MYREFKDEGATVRVYGNAKQEAVKEATKTFLKGVEDEKKKIKKENA
jgi:hypothetical protein